MPQTAIERTSPHTSKVTQEEATVSGRPRLFGLTHIFQYCVVLERHRPIERENVGRADSSCNRDI